MAQEKHGQLLSWTVEKAIKLLTQLWEIRCPWETTILFPVPEDG